MSLFVFSSLLYSCTASLVLMLCHFKSSTTHKSLKQETSSNQAVIILPHGEKERVDDTGTDDGQ